MPQFARVIRWLLVIIVLAALTPPSARLLGTLSHLQHRKQHASGAALPDRATGARVGIESRDESASHAAWRRRGHHRGCIRARKHDRLRANDPNRDWRAALCCLVPGILRRLKERLLGQHYSTLRTANAASGFDNASHARIPSDPRVLPENTRRAVHLVPESADSASAAFSAATWVL